MDVTASRSCTADRELTGLYVHLQAMSNEEHVPVPHDWEQEADSREHDAAAVACELDPLPWHSAAEQTAPPMGAEQASAAAAAVMAEREADAIRTMQRSDYVGSIFIMNLHENIDQLTI